MFASRLNSCIRKSSRRPTGSCKPSTRRVSPMCVLSRSSSSSTSVRVICSTSSCSSRPGSTGCFKSASRVSSRVRRAARISGIQPRTSLTTRSMPSSLSRRISPSFSPSRSRVAVSASSARSSTSNSAACCVSGSTSACCITPGKRNSSVNCTCRPGNSTVMSRFSSDRRDSSVLLTCSDSPRASPPRSRTVRSSLPRDSFAATRSRSCDSKPRNSSGRRGLNSR